MKQRVQDQTAPSPTVSLHIEAVRYRSSAWCQLWWQDFIAAVRDLDRLDAGRADARPSGRSDAASGGIQC